MDGERERKEGGRDGGRVVVRKEGWRNGKIRKKRESKRKAGKFGRK